MATLPSRAIGCWILVMLGIFSHGSGWAAPVQSLAEIQEIRSLLASQEGRARLARALAQGGDARLQEAFGAATAEQMRADPEHAHLLLLQRLDAAPNPDIVRKAQAILGVSPQRDALGTLDAGLGEMQATLRLPTPASATSPRAPNARYRLLAIYDLDGAIDEAVLSADGSKAVLSTRDGEARLLTLSPRGQIFRTTRFNVTTNSVPKAALSPDGLTLLVTRPDGAILAFDTESGISLHSRGIKDLQREPARSVSISPDGRLAVSTTFDGRLNLWMARSGTKRGTIWPSQPPARPRDQFIKASFSENSKSILALSIDRFALEVLDANSGDANQGSARVEITTQGSPFRSAASSPDGQRIVTASADNSVRIWDAKTGAELQAFLDANPSGSPIHSAKFSADGKFILAFTDEGVFFLDPFSGTVQGAIRLPEPGTMQGSLPLPDTRRGSPLDLYLYSAQGERLVRIQPGRSLQIWGMER